METEIEKKIREILSYAEKRGLYPENRTVETNEPETVVNEKKVLLFCSLNYLGLAGHPSVKKAAIEAIQKYGVGAGGARFVSGNYKLHDLLEKKVAQFKQEEAALIFQTGYVTNVGVIPPLLNLPKMGPFAFLTEKGVILVMN